MNLRWISLCCVSLGLSAATPVLDNLWNYEQDQGELFADRGKGLHYGWAEDKRSDVVDADAATSPDERYDSGVAMEAGDVWELALEPGFYRVSVTAGNPTRSSSTQHLLVEGQEVLNASPNAQWPWLGAAVVVEVTDGRLSVEAGANASGCVLAQLHVMSTQGGSFATPTKATLPLKVNAGGGTPSGDYLADKPFVENGDYGYVIDPLDVRARFPDTDTLSNFDGNAAYGEVRSTREHTIPIRYQVRVDPDTEYRVRLGLVNTGTNDSNKMVYEVHTHDRRVLPATDFGINPGKNKIREISFAATSDQDGLLKLELRSVATFSPYPPRLAWLEVEELVLSPESLETLSVNFKQDANAVVDPGSFFGVQSARNWNNVDWADRGKDLSNLMEGDGELSGVTLQFSADNTGYDPGGVNPAANPESAMLRNSIGRNSATVTLSNLMEEYPNGFDLYVYSWGGHNQLPSSKQRSFSLNVADTPVFYSLAHDGAFSGWNESAGTSSATATLGNVVLWRGIKGVDQLMLSGNKVQTGPYICGLQLVPLPPPGRSYNQAYLDTLFAGDPRGSSGPHTRFSAKGNGVMENGLIFAFGIDDLDPAAAEGLLPELHQVEENGESYFAIRFRRLAGGAGNVASASGYEVSGIRYVVQWASSLMGDDWQSSSEDLELMSQDPHADGTETVVVRYSTPLRMAPPGPTFLRTTVEQLP